MSFGEGKKRVEAIIVVAEVLNLKKIVKKDYVIKEASWRIVLLD